MVIPAYTTVCTVVSLRTSMPNRGPMDKEIHTGYLVSKNDLELALDNFF